MKTKSFTVIILLLVSSHIVIAQTKSAAFARRDAPVIKLKKSISAPDYCVSTGGSTTFERITNVHVLEKPGNLLDITVVVFIANPSGCQSGEPCPVYDNSPEYVNVWIDWDGDKTWEPYEKVLDEELTGYQNISYSGTMVAKSTVTIPVNAKKPTWLRANLGWGFDPEDPCRVSWGFGNVVDQQVLGNLRVREISAITNIDMIGVSNPKWQGSYDQTGNLISTVVNPPIAASMKTGNFVMPIELISFPNTFGDGPITEINWQVKQSPISGTGVILGKSGMIDITLPQSIGFYELELRFIFKNKDNSRIGEQTITLPLWVSFDSPKITNIKKEWLQKAIEWTQGSNDPSALAFGIMDGIYSKSGWKYYTYNFLWSKLLDGQETSGNCNVMAIVWMNLLKTLGVSGASIVTHSGTVNNTINFMVKPGFKAFGELDTEDGNATDDLVFHTYDRWIFASHTFGKLGEFFYDPTFNKKDTEKYFHVAYNFIDRINGMLISSPAGATAEAFGKFKEQGGFWEAWKYNISGSSPNKSFFEKSSFAEGASFTGSFSGTPIDLNSDGIYDQLGTNIGVEITSTGNYIVSGVLRKNSLIISSKPYFASPSSSHEGLGPQTGILEVQVLFSGEDISSKAKNGPYAVELYINDSTGALTDTVTFNTSAYSFSEFGELPAKIIQMTETAIDTSGDGSFDLITANFDINSTRTGNYSIELTLLHDGNPLITEYKDVPFNAGMNSLNLSMDARSISVSNLNGPFLLSLQILDNEGVQSAYREINTAAYSASQFSKPLACIIGGSSDAGIDINGNSLYDFLSVSINLESSSEAPLEIIAWLKDQNGETITWASVIDTPDIGSNIIQLLFSGQDVSKSGLNGPYKIGYATIIDSSSISIFSGTDVYSTQSYDASQFEPELPLLITASGNLSESIIDTDSDGLIDSLVFEVEVTPRDSGNVIALARLVDSEGETILWSSVVNFLKEDIPQFLKMKFDGKYIYGSLSNGPYYLKDLQVYHAGDPSQIVEIPDALTTQNYAHIDFEKTGVVTGTVLDVNDNPVQSAVLVIPNADFDYSNANGKYNLVLLESGDYYLKIEGPDTLNLNWSIYSNGTLLGTGDSVAVSVDSHIVQIDFEAPITITGIKESYPGIIPFQNYLEQNFPNPFNPKTKIRFYLNAENFVTLKIHDVLGREVTTLVNQNMHAGTHEVEFSPSSEISSGIYFYQLKAGNFTKTKKLILLE